jgi:hypothetical protein
MEKVIEKASRKSKADALPEESERPKKKSKKSKKKEEEEIPPPEEIEVIPDEKTEAKRKELKILMLNYPGVQLDKILEIQSFITKMDKNEVNYYLDNFKFAIGIKPTDTSENIVGMIGILLQRQFGDPRIYQQITTDAKLLSSVEQIVPSFGEWLSIPLQIVHRVACHVCTMRYGENNMTPDTIEKNKTSFDLCLNATLCSSRKISICW